MSTNRDDILESSTDEKTRELAGVLIAYRPQIRIDRDFQHALRKKLMSPVVQKSHRFAHVSWYGWMTGIGMVSASCVAVIGLYQIWSSTPLRIQFSYPLSISSTQTEDTPSVYTEDKAIEFARTAPPADIAPAPMAAMMTAETLQTGTTTDTERAEMTAEIEDMARELLTTRPSTSDIPTSLAGTPTLRETPAMMSMKSTTSDTSLPSVIIPSYPSVMNVYSKPTKWQSYEIANRSGENMTTKITKTETASIIQEKSESQIGERAIISADIIYMPMSRIVPEPERRYYLIPTIDYRLEGEAHVYIPLIRGYR